MHLPSFVEFESAIRIKKDYNICGDAVHVVKNENEGRIIGVLSDGLGSGVKANVLASMTAHMAAKFVESEMDIVRSSEIMLDALPVCQLRKISYATFSIVDCRLDGQTQVIEMDNPPFLLVRKGEVIDLPYETLTAPRWENRVMRITRIALREGDRLVFFSDGITQAGLGSARLPLGWRREGCVKFVKKIVRQKPDISARHLSRLIVEEAREMEPDGEAGDDMSCVVLYQRKPRRLMVLSGPPFNEERDGEYAAMLNEFEGATAICGGTTANIIERELDLKGEIDSDSFDPEIPPATKMKGVDLVTEGILTLTRVAKILKTGEMPKRMNGARQLAELLLESDEVVFVVGTRINNAHQDPNLPVDLEIRRNVIKKIARRLRQKHLKDVEIHTI